MIETVIRSISELCWCVINRESCLIIIEVTDWLNAEALRHILHDYQYIEMNGSYAGTLILNNKLMNKFLEPSTEVRKSP